MAEDSRGYFYHNVPNAAEIRYYFGSAENYNRARAMYFAKLGEAPTYNTFCSLCENTFQVNGGPCPLPHYRGQP